MVSLIGAQEWLSCPARESLLRISCVDDVEALDVFRLDISLNSSDQ